MKLKSLPFQPVLAAVQASRIPRTAASATAKLLLQAAVPPASVPSTLHSQAPNANAMQAASTSIRHQERPTEGRAHSQRVAQLAIIGEGPSSSPQHLGSVSRPESWFSCARSGVRRARAGREISGSLARQSEPLVLQMFHVFALQCNSGAVWTRAQSRAST